MAKKRNIIMTFFESAYGALTPDKAEQATASQQVYRSFRAKAQAQRNQFERLADSVTGLFGSFGFALFHVVWFIGWFTINLGYVPGIIPFDPYPFSFLTMTVSLEAIFLAIFVLISQNRESQITSLREEVDFQINMNAEKEITKLIEMVSKVHDHLGISPKKDKELEAMKKDLDPAKLEAEIKEEVDES